MKYSYIAIIAFAALLSMSACGSSTDGDGSATEIVSAAGTDPVDFENGSRKLTPAQLDSLIINHPDELTPGEAVGALEYLYHRIGSLSGTKREVEMRKFTDLYGIALNNDGQQFRSAIEKLRKSQSIDLSAVYDDFSGNLAYGDEVGGGVSVDDVRDTIKTFNDSLGTDITEVEVGGAVIRTIE